MVMSESTGSRKSAGEQARSLLQRLYEEVVGQGNLQAAEELVSPDFVDHVPQPFPGQPTTGVKAITWLAGTIRTALPDVHVTIEDLLVDGNRAVARVTWKGTHTGRLLGIEPTGRTISFAGFDMLRIIDGKIAEHWGQVDVLAMLAQLGFLPDL